MRNSGRTLGRTILGLAVAGAFAPAYGQEAAADVAELTRPQSAIAVGGAHVTGDERDRSIFGQYNGLRPNSNYLLLDFDYVKRDDPSGTWTSIRGRNLGLEIPEIGFTIQRQGDWRISGDYNEIVHHEIRTINSGMVNVGTTNPNVVVVAPGAGGDLNFEMKRKAFGLSGDKWIGTGLQFEVAFKNEDKDGTRLWGRGYDCASYVCTTTQNATNQRWAVLMIPEPVNFNMKQVDAKMNFVAQKLFVSAGYYGSFFTNTYGNVAPTVPNQLLGPTGVLTTLNPAAATGVNPTGGTSLQNVLQLPMALYPDNQAHQFYLSGNYAWTQKTRSTFKLSYTHATQDEDFGAMGFTGLPAVTRSNLGGVIDTRRAQFGVSSRPTDKLNLLADFRYEQRDDKTPIDLYNVENTVRWNNRPSSNRKTDAKVEAGYRLPANIRATVGVDYQRLSRELPPPDVDIAGISALRGSTEEITYRGELRRAISETLTGSLGVAHSDRKGSDWFNLCVSSACATQGLVYGGLYGRDAIYQRTGTFPFNYSDRKRDKVKATTDWTPTERLSFQFVAEGGHDSYSPPSENGLQTGNMNLFSVDAAYSLTERWKISGYGSLAEQSMSEADRSTYVAETTNRNTAFGIGISGKPTGVLEIGAGMTRVLDLTKYRLQPDSNLPPPAGPTSLNNILQNGVGLPDTSFSQNVYSAYARYAIDKKSDVRLDVTRVISKLEEWSWGYGGVPFVYSDGTTVGLQSHQQVTVAMARYIYKF